MKIDSSNSNPLYLKDLEQAKAAPLKQTPKEQESTARATDRIEISPEAKMLQSNNVSGKDLEQIKERINTNFYHSDEVLAKVAQAIIKDMDNK